MARRLGQTEMDHQVVDIREERQSLLNGGPTCGGDALTALSLGRRGKATCVPEDLPRHRVGDAAATGWETVGFQTEMTTRRVLGREEAAAARAVKVRDLPIVVEANVVLVGDVDLQSTVGLEASSTARAVEVLNDR